MLGPSAVFCSHMFVSALQWVIKVGSSCYIYWSGHPLSLYHL